MKYIANGWALWERFKTSPKEWKKFKSAEWVLLKWIKAQRAIEVAHGRTDTREQT